MPILTPYWGLNISIFAFLSAALITGYVKNALKLKRINSNIGAVQDYRDDFIEWAHSDFLDREIESKLVYKSVSINKIIGVYGLIDFQPPYKNYIVRNHSVILNFIPTISQLSNDHLLRSQVEEYSRAVDHSLLRAMGAFDDKRLEAFKKFNPLDCFFTGLSTILAIPIYILSMSGLVTRNFYVRYIDGFFSRIVSMIVLIAAISSAVVTIFADWDSAIEKFRSIYNTLLVSLI